MTLQISRSKFVTSFVFGTWDHGRELYVQEDLSQKEQAAKYSERHVMLDSIIANVEGGSKTWHDHAC